jgi:hypothetical protein
MRPGYGWRIGFGFVALMAAGSVLVGCGQGVADYPYGRKDGSPEWASDFETYQSNRQSVFGSEGLTFWGRDENKGTGTGGGGIGVNSYLWRASLDTISFMPVSSADPFGGVILTDWHSHSEAPNERFKLNVYILGRALRGDGVRVAVFRQVRDPRGDWKDAGLPENTGIKIEDSILTKARHLRNETLRQE